MTALTTAHGPHGREASFNKHGFLARFEDWDDEFARTLARDEGLKLTDCHWTVIEFLREYYAFHEIPPSPKVIIKGIGDQVSKHAPCTKKTLDALFPDGGCKQACRLAGLPRHYCHSC
jgi:TusE/DsrC/DsvC family sulfur relay protein